MGMVIHKWERQQEPYPREAPVEYYVFLCCLECVEKQKYGCFQQKRSKSEAFIGD